MSKDEIIENLKKSEERIEESRRFDMEDAIAVMDALVFIVNNTEEKTNW